MHPGGLDRTSLVQAARPLSILAADPHTTQTVGCLRYAKCSDKMVP